jgi:hypothetical protein
MTEKKYKYTAKIKQPQTVGNIKLDPTGGVLTEREYKTLKQDAYGASLLEKGLLVFEGAPSTTLGETVPDFEANNSKGGKGK